MTVIDDRTTNRNYTLPVGPNQLSDDVDRVRSAFSSIDGDVASLLAGLALKANSVHSHTISDITGLQAALDAKADGGGGTTAYAPLASPNFSGSPTAPTPTQGDASTRLATTAFVSAALTTGLAAKANVSHSHAIGDVTGLQTALDGKSNVGHTHSAGAITGLAPVAISGAYSDITGKPTLGTSAAKDVGTAAGQVIALDGSGKLPAVDGSQLTGIVPASSFGAIGTYVLARLIWLSGTPAQGGTISGASLEPVGMFNTGGFYGSGGSLSGTWRNMGGAVPGNLGGADDGYRIGLFVRIL